MPTAQRALQVVLGGLQFALHRPVSELIVLSSCIHSFSRPSGFGPHTTSTSMLLQTHRHVAASAKAAGAAAPPPAKGSGQRVPTRVHAASNKKPKGPSSGDSSSLAAVPKEMVLQQVPGIGKVYMQRLQANQIRSVNELADNILSKLSCAETSFLPAVKYLQELGIKRQDHAQRIVKHITAKFDQDLYSRLQEFEGMFVQDKQGGLIKTPPLTLCVEGNISAGKSTFLQYITNKNEELQQLLGVVHEPVDEWQAVRSSGGSTLNLLDKFYQDPQKYAYTFQNYVFMSRVMQERKSANIEQPVRLMERSVFSDRMVFVRAVKESGWMGDVELAVYDSWFGPILDTSPSLVPDGFIYLRCTPNTCMERLKMRARSEETTVGMDYLEGLHEKHEDWLGAGPRITELRRARRRDHSGNLLLPNGLLLPENIPSSLKDSLYVLQKDRSAKEMHTVLNGVPALVLDCEGDVLRDEKLQQQVQQTVADYISLMRQHREQREQMQQQRLKYDSSRTPAPSEDSSSSSGGYSDRRRPRCGIRSSQPEASEDVQQAIEFVQSTADADFTVVPNSSGELQQRAPVVSGGLEALHVAVNNGNDGRVATASAVL